MTTEMEEAARQFRGDTFSATNNELFFARLDELMIGFALKAVSDREKEIVGKLRELPRIRLGRSVSVPTGNLERVADEIERGE